jgi:hypothetical protein
MAVTILAIVALAVSIVALVLYVLQAIWGKPKIRLGFDVRETKDARALLCQIYNKPIMKGLPYRLRIKRMVAEDVTADFSIKECGSNRVVFPGVVPCILSYTGVTNAQRISLPASLFPANFPIVTVDYGTGQVEVFDENVTIPPGEYCAYANVVADAEVIKAQRNFVVSDKHPFAYWI